MTAKPWFARGRPKNADPEITRTLKYADGVNIKEVTNATNAKYKRGQNKAHHTLTASGHLATSGIAPLRKPI